MERDERLQERIEGMQAEARQRLGAPPTPEEILAYLEHRLAAAKRLRVEEGVAAFPEAARLLRDLARFPDVRPDPGVALPSQSRVDARWQAFRERRRGARLDPQSSSGGTEPLGGAAATGGLKPGKPSGVQTAAPLPGATPDPVLAADSRSHHTRALRWLRLAALITVTAGLGLLVGLLVAPEGGRINLALASLTPVGDSASRGEATVVRLPESAEGVLLSLGYAAAAPHPEYTLAIRDERGDAVWQRRGLRPATGGSFLVVLPAGILEPGRYELELSVPGETVPAAAYALRLEAE